MVEYKHVKGFRKLPNIYYTNTFLSPKFCEVTSVRDFCRHTMRVPQVRSGSPPTVVYRYHHQRLTFETYEPYLNTRIIQLFDVCLFSFFHFYNQITTAPLTAAARVMNTYFYSAETPFYPFTAASHLRRG